ncbi:hypothetical protein JCM3765_003040 [Sporobolomyces pararoseus]
MGKRAEKRLEHRLAYDNASIPSDDSELVIYDGPIDPHRPQIEIQVRVTLKSTKLMEKTGGHLLGQFHFGDADSAHAWQLPALVVLATNDLVSSESEEMKHYLAATLAAAVRFWRLAQPNQRTRRFDFLASSGALIGCDSSLIVPGFNRIVQTKLSFDQSSVLEKAAIAKLEAPGWDLITGACAEIKGFVSNPGHQSRLPPLNSTNADHISSKRKRRSSSSSSSLSKSPFAPCPRSKIQSFPFVLQPCVRLQ